MDPDALPQADPSKMDFEKATDGPKAWKEIWGSGQGISAVKAIVPTQMLVDRLDEEYRTARARICA
jgi:nitronate monooxygenase